MNFRNMIKRVLGAVVVCVGIVDYATGMQSEEANGKEYLGISQQELASCVGEFRKVAANYGAAIVDDLLSNAANFLEKIEERSPTLDLLSQDSVHVNEYIDSCEDQNASLLNSFLFLSSENACDFFYSKSEQASFINYIAGVTCSAGICCPLSQRVTKIALSRGAVMGSLGALSVLATFNRDDALLLFCCENNDGHAVSLLYEGNCAYKYKEYLSGKPLPKECSGFMLLFFKAIKDGIIEPKWNH
ncbi:MAG: hypothetical protein LBJ89_02550 [Holosporales bacterium]|jgi:hypothetical protein|nr:hypothetical protein [Holosporales bacterium]